MISVFTRRTRMPLSEAIHRGSRRVLVLLSAAGYLSLVQCGSAQPLTPLPHPPVAPTPGPTQTTTEPTWQPTPDAPFRQQPPESGPETIWLGPVPVVRKLSNG
ncbi:MAG: hypothetical protein MUF54_06030, partial [Polyangiaceae bacterium]|nr:hypothetical protein [Polyangiaceae bacterium]